MARNVAIGIQSFEDIIKGKYFYIDNNILLIFVRIEILYGNI